MYPIKVNQQRLVVEEVYRYGSEFGFGLEVGSKPELLAVMAMTENAPDRLIVCNGFKDDSYIEAVTLATKLGRTIIPVVEKYTELNLILEYAEKIGVRQNIGMRVKLATGSVDPMKSTLMCASVFQVLATNATKQYELPIEFCMCVA